MSNHIGGSRSSCILHIILNTFQRITANSIYTVVYANLSLFLTIGVASYTGHWGMCFLSTSNNLIFLSVRAAYKVTGHFMPLPFQTYLYSATAAAVVQSPLHEPCSAYYFAPFYVRQKVSCSFVPTPSHQIPATPLSLTPNGLGLVFQNVYGKMSRRDGLERTANALSASMSSRHSRNCRYIKSTCATTTSITRQRAPGLARWVVRLAMC